jgi:acyl-CoA thioester hydrolase
LFVKNHEGFNPAHPPSHAPGLRVHASTHRLRVRYNECDPMGVAHHGSYASWLEIGRTELLRESGVSYAQLEQDGVFLVIVRLTINYKRPVRYDDTIEVRTTWRSGGKVKIEHDYEVWLVEQAGHPMGSINEPRASASGPPAASAPAFTPFLAATAQTTLGCIDRTGRIRALPEWLAT